MVHHRHRRGGGAVDRRREPSSCRHRAAQLGKPVRRHEQCADRLHLVAPHHRRERADDNGGENHVLARHGLRDLIGDRPGGVAWRVASEARERLRVGNIGRPEQRDVDHLVQRQVEADAEREDECAGDGKGRRAHQPPHAESQILQRIVEPVPAPRVARLFEQSMRVAESRWVVHRLAVAAHLVHELALVAAAIDQVPDATEPGAHGRALVVRWTRRWPQSRRPCAGSRPVRSRAASIPLR